MRGLTAVCLLCLLLLLGTVWQRLQPTIDQGAPPAATAAATTTATPLDARRTALIEARRRYDPQRLDAFVTAQQREVAARPTDAAAMQLLAEALLERVLLRNRLRGLAIGEPLYAELPAEVAHDLDDAQRLLRRARELGDDSADNLRLEASVLGNRITGLAAALQWNGTIEQDLGKAIAKEPNNPALHVALGLRRLLAPRLLGHDPEKALQHFEFAAAAMPDDERPRVFAAMASWLLRKRQQAIQWIEQALAQNPDNAFAQVVLQRLRRDEPEPFARDVTVAEAAAARAR